MQKMRWPICWRQTEPTAIEMGGTPVDSTFNNSVQHHARTSRPGLANVISRALLLIVLLVVGLFLRRSAQSAKSGLDPEAVPRAVATPGPRSPEEEANIQIYEKMSPSVVQVTSLSERADNWRRCWDILWFR
jgi:hypothetical protein